MADRRRLWGLLIRAFVGTVVTAVVLTAAAQGAAAAPGAVPQQAGQARLTILNWDLDGSTFTVIGTAVPETVVRLLAQTKAGARWHPVARAEVGVDGGWTARFRDPTHRGATKDGRFTIRVEQVISGDTVLRLEGTLRWAGIPEPADEPSGPAPAPEPTPAPAAPAYNADAPPAGAAASYAFMHVNGDGTPARWNPCQPIPYFVNPASMPEGAATTVAEAFNRITALTGIVFVDSGGTSTIPWAGGAAMLTAERGLGIYVAFADPSTVPHLAGPVAGMGGHFFTSWPSTDMRVIAGALVVDVSETFDLGFTSGHSIGAVLEHELGHVMGLGHVDDPTQLMNPHASKSGPSTFQAGDRAGLQALQGGGCF
jgi:hypothetical protein